MLDYAQNHEQFEINQLVLRQHTCTKQPLIYTPLIFKKYFVTQNVEEHIKAHFLCKKVPTLSLCQTIPIWRTIGVANYFLTLAMIHPTCLHLCTKLLSKARKGDAIHPEKSALFTIY